MIDTEADRDNCLQCRMPVCLCNEISLEEEIYTGSDGAAWQRYDGTLDDGETLVDQRNDEVVYRSFQKKEV